MRGNKSGNICFQYTESGTCSFGSQCKFSHDPQAKSRPTKNRAKGKTRQRNSRQTEDIDAFFTQYEDFDYDQSAPVWAEFNRMCDDFGWDSEDYEMREAKRGFKSAMVQQFNGLYGTDVKDLDAWHKLCCILNIEPVPEGLKECRERVRQTHVNLVDLVDTPRTGRAVTVFPNLKKLQEYTIETGKFFPKKDAYAGGLLRFLLREIFG